ncbi:MULTISPECIES: MCE family protein [Mycobacteriaceae]|uniref:MCE family protein n=1 Tax=Mycobacteriaceae TaxID=1762 RepID=UPI000300E8FF|nr:MULTISPECIES: MCE family protein [Mycobacteriaceae]MDO3403096.1 MCE family protein [Mycolicibacterium neoaurum]WBP94837.1 MCE family protein [Mycolicibacterium neoaurum]WBS08864.1 MCE family protein [Mycolicibacterium neoaurum]
MTSSSAPSRHNAVRITLALALVAILGAGVYLVVRTAETLHRVNVVAYFDSSNGIFVGDDVVILGVPVGRIEKIEPEPERVKISFWYDGSHKVPENVNAAILSPMLVTSRAIQLTPTYSEGPVLQDNAVIGQDRTVVPVEYDDVREQLHRITETLQPTEPGGVSELGAFINTAADNLRGQGADIRATLVKLSQAISAVGDHSTDVFATVKNLSILVSALQDSTDVMRSLNQNLASVTGTLADNPTEVGNAVQDLSETVGLVQNFVADNRETLGTTSDKLAGVTTALNESLGDLKQFLHVAPTSFQNYINIYQPAQGAVSSVPVINNFANPISFLCGAVQAASRLNAEQSSKLCVQYLAPIVKNRQYNFLPIGQNLGVTASARPNELTWSEDWLRPDYIPPAGPPPPPAPVDPNSPAAPVPGPPLAAELAQPTNPAAGLPGLMVPTGPGS